MKELGPKIREFTKRLRRDYALEIAADPWAFKRKAKRLLCLYLPPGPGRPRKATITRALELHREGTSWPDIYRECIPNHISLPWKGQLLEIIRLRNAVRARKHLDQKAAPRKNPKADISR